MLPTITKQFAAVRSAPLQVLEVPALVELLAKTEHAFVLTHRWVGPHYATTVYDETAKVCYRAIHAHGILGFWKTLARSNRNLRLLARDESYKPEAQQ